MTIIDISRYFDDGREIDVRLHASLPVYKGYSCKAFDLFIKSHGGTYFETASHLFDGAPNTDEFPMESLFIDVSMLDVPDNVTAIDASVLKEHSEHLCQGDAVLIRTGCRQECFLERNSADWMKEMNIPLFGMDIELYDTGFENPTGVFVDLFRHGIAIIAGLVNLDRISSKRARLIVLPLKVKGVSTVPCRAVVLEGS